MIYADLLGIPYELGGRDSARSLDCWGLCVEVCRRAGIELPDFQSPGSFEDVAGVMERARPEFVKIPGPEPYCIVAFCLRGKWVNHAGVVMEDGRSFIHCLRGRNVAVERLDHLLWSKVAAGFYKWAGK